MRPRVLKQLFVCLLVLPCACDDVIVNATDDAGQTDSTGPKGDTGVPFDDARAKTFDGRAEEGGQRDASLDGSPDSVPQDAAAADLASWPTNGLCPGSMTFANGGLSGIYSGTATVPGDAHTPAGTYPATVAVASVCGHLRAILVIESSINPLNVPSYKLKASGSGNSLQVVLSDRYCGSVDCSPHLQSGAGMEIFTATAAFTNKSVAINQTAILPSIAYPGLALPFTALAATRVFPTDNHVSSAPLSGKWTARLATTTAILAGQTMYGDNVVQIGSANTFDSWVFDGGYDALQDSSLFPSKWLAAQERRVGAIQSAPGGKYIYSAVLDGNWIIGVVKEGMSPFGAMLDVPTIFTEDDGLWGIWLGQRI